MFKKINKKGFTLAELLIVVAIIGVLVAISIPIFTAQLDKAKDATNLANSRSLYAQLVADYLVDNKVDSTGSAISGWNGNDNADLELIQDGAKNIYKMTKVNNAKLEVDVTGAPIVTYTHSDGTTKDVFGTTTSTTTSGS